MTYNDTFFASYLETALWASINPGTGDALDQADLPVSPETLAGMRRDCDRFISDNWATLVDIHPRAAGHDFFLTRNRHGAGFWDGDYPDDVGDRLTEASHAFGEVDLYVTDDDQIGGHE